MDKLAAVSPAAWNSLTKALANQRDVTDAMLSLGKKFKIDPSEAEKLLIVKRMQYPKTKLVFIDDSTNFLRPAYYPDINTITSYDEPWSYMHEYGHVRERADVFDKARRALPFKTKLSPKQEALLKNYVEEAYMSGNRNSKELGTLINKAVEDSKQLKERDTWRMNEELRSNARAYLDTKTITGQHNSEKLLQPLVLSDATYVGSFYPDELAKVVGGVHVGDDPRKNINLLTKIKNLIGKVNNGMPA